MSLTESKMLKLLSPMPKFQLLDVVTDKIIDQNYSKDAKATLMMFICNHCPYVKHVWDEFSRLEQDYTERGVTIIAINSNDINNYPQDGPEHMKLLSQTMNWSFPFLLDDKQTLAQSMLAACTPDFYVFDQKQSLVYRGQLDDSRPGHSKQVSGKDVRAALDSVLLDKRPSEQQVPSMGCNIKWIPGNEPDYF